MIGHIPRVQREIAEDAIVPGEPYLAPYDLRDQMPNMMPNQIISNFLWMLLILGEVKKFDRSLNRNRESGTVKHQIPHDLENSQSIKI